MLKLLFSFTCVAACVSAATIVVNSGGYVTFQSSYQDSVNLSAGASGAPPHQPNGFVGEARLAGDFILTITGGAGQSALIPCLYAGETLIGSEAAGVASFASVTIANAPLGGNGVRTCSGGSFGDAFPVVAATPIPFTFGVPLEFAVSLRVSVSEGSGVAELYGIRYYNGGMLVPAQFTLTEVPEPVAFGLIGGALAAMGIFRPRAMR